MDRASFVAGVRDAAPTLPPNVPFGMLFGATAVQVGFDPIAATALSVFTFAATAQLAAVELLRSGSDLPVVLATILLINLRYVVYSASLAPEVDHLSRRWRAAIAYPLFDISYALSIARFTGEDEKCDGVGGEDEERDGNDVDGDDHARSDDGGARPRDDHRGWYFLGTALPMVAVFAGSTLAGALAGQVVGSGLHLSFAIPLIFVALLVPSIDGRAGAVVAAVAGLVAVAGAGLPYNLGLLAAAVAGTVVASLAQRGSFAGWSA